MRISILGGTGSLGRMLTIGWKNQGLDVVLGSRDPNGAYQKISSWEQKCPVATNVEAVTDADLVVLSVPWAGLDPILNEIIPHLKEGATLLSVVVPLVQGQPTKYDVPPEGSAAEHIAAQVPDGISVVSGFHTISAAGTGNGDILYCGQSVDARNQIRELSKWFGPTVDCGPLRMSQTLERLTPLLIGLNKRFRLKGAGVRITGLKGE